MALKGIVLTLDAVIAFLIVIAVISLLVFFRIESTSPFFESQQLHALSEDVLSVLSESTLREITNQSLINQYLSSGILSNSDLDKNAIDVIGALWSENKTDADLAAENITKDILDNFLPQNVGYEILINENKVYNSSDTSRPSYSSATSEISSLRIASGYEKNKSTSGYVARAWATKIKRNVTTIIPINLEWGGFSSGSYWANGYAPTSEEGYSSILIKNFTIPTDATIFSGYLQLALDNGFTQVFINGNSVFSKFNPTNTPNETNITRYLTPGLNQFKMVVNSTISANGDALAHFHPGTYMKIKYNTTQVESGSNVTVFNADWIQGAPAAIEIIPFFVNAQIKNVTAYVDIKNINAFLLLTLNYRYNASNPLQNVLLYRNYTIPIDCSQYSSQSNCQARPDQCFWNSTSSNSTIFDDGFETDITTNWTATSRWVRINEFPHGGSYTAKIAGSSTPRAGNLSTKILNTIGVNEIYVDLWFRDDDCDANDVWVQYNDSSGNWDNIRDISSDVNYLTEDTWTEWTQKVTDNQYLHSGFAVRFKAQNIENGENFWVDDVKIIKNTSGICQNRTIEDIKNRTYEIKLNGTGTLINEYNSSWYLLNSSFNTNVTLNDIKNNMTNTLGIYADIRPPTNYTVDSTDSNGGMDWQRLGMYANNYTTGHGNDHYCFITDKTNVTVYHELEQYGLEYGKVDITSVQNFTDTLVCCESKKGTSCYIGNSDNRTCKDAFLNLTFPFVTRMITSRVIGTEDLGGNDNGYNWVWMWNDSSPTNETTIVLDTDTPPGTFTYLPTKYFELGRNNTIRVGDKDNGRWLDTNPTVLIGNKRSIVEYTFLIPSQVGYGDVFENQINATQNATDRLNLILGSYSTSADIMTENYSVSNVPYMWGPSSVRVRLWA